MVTDISDHFPIVHLNYNLKSKTSNEFIVRRVHSERNKQAFIAAMNNVNWTAVLECQDTQTAFTLFHRKIIELYDSHFPKRKITFKYNNRKPWLSD